MANAQLPTFFEQTTLRTFECPTAAITLSCDLLTFCPWCGPEKTPPYAVFEDNLAAQDRLLALVEELPEASIARPVASPRSRSGH